MGDKVKKIYIGSRFRTSGTPTDFTINLIDDIECSEDQVVYVNAVSFPNTIYTAQGTNNKLYVLEAEWNASTYSYTYNARILTIPDGTALAYRLRQPSLLLSRQTGQSLIH